jgi:hypothetical protein
MKRYFPCFLLFSFIYLSSCEIKKDETINNKIIIEDSFTKIDSVVLADSAIKENKVIIPEIDQIRSKDISIEGIRLKDPKTILVTKFGNPYGASMIANKKNLAQV